MGVVGVGDSDGLLFPASDAALTCYSQCLYVCGADDLLGQRGQDLVPLRCVEGGHPCGVLEGGLELGKSGRARKGGHGALRDGGRLAEDGGTHEGCHCGRGIGIVGKNERAHHPGDVRR